MRQVGNANICVTMPTVILQGVFYLKPFIPSCFMTFA